MAIIEGRNSVMFVNDTVEELLNQDTVQHADQVPVEAVDQQMDNESSNVVLDDVGEEVDGEVGREVGADNPQINGTNDETE